MNIYLFKHKNFKDNGRRTVGDRLKPTLEIAMIEKDKYSAKARWTGYALNAAIGMQVLLGSLTTGLSALAVSGGKSVNIFLMVFYNLSDTIVSLKTAAATTALGMLQIAILTSSFANGVTLI